MTECDVARKQEDAEETGHLDELPDGSGCTEIWEHLSERRQREREDGDDRASGEED